jgi:hypothetical protein
MFSAIDDEYLRNSPQESRQPIDSVSRVAFAVGNVKLGEILGEILLQVYNQHDGSHGPLEPSSHSNKSQNTSLESLAELEACLVAFEESLPPGLKWNTCESPGDSLPRSLLRQRMVLQVRCVHETN